MVRRRDEPHSAWGLLLALVGLTTLIDVLLRWLLEPLDGRRDSDEEGLE